MELNIRNTLSVPGIEDEVVFMNPYLNDDKELIFRYCTYKNEFMPGTYVLNEKKKGIEVRGGERKYVIILKEQLQDIEYFSNARKTIITDLGRLNSNLKRGREKIIAFETGLEEYPFLFTTQTILDNGIYSSKYTTALVYSLNEKLKEVGKDIRLSSYEEAQKVMGNALLKSLKQTKLKKRTMGMDECYELTLLDIANMM